MIEQFDEVAEVIRTGRITLHTTRKELITLLGAPPAEGGQSRKYPVPCVWKYGDVQFVFPRARNRAQADAQCLEYVYVDEGVGDLAQPLFLLKATANRKGAEDP